MEKIISSKRGNIIMRRVNFAWFAMLIIVLCGAQHLFAGNESKKGTAGAQELLLPIGAQGIGLGGSNLATIHGIEAIYWNPAGVARINENGEALFSRMNYIANIGVNFGAVAINLNEVGVLALSMKSIDFGSIPVTTELYPEGTGDSYSPTYSVFGLSYARSLTDLISLGVTAKLIMEKIMNTSATGVAFDAGVQYAFGEQTVLSGFKFAVALKNIGPTMQYDGTDLERTVVPPNTPWNNTPRSLKYTSEEFEMPSTLELGLAYEYFLTEENRITVNTVFENANFGNDEYRIGLEYAFYEQFFLRGGYLFAPATAAAYATIYDLHAGAGVNLDIDGFRVQLDYAYRRTHFFQGTNSISLEIGF